MKDFFVAPTDMSTMRDIYHRHFCDTANSKLATYKTLVELWLEYHASVRINLAFSPMAADIRLLAQYLFGHEYKQTLNKIRNYKEAA